MITLDVVSLHVVTNVPSSGSKLFGPGVHHVSFGMHSREVHTVAAILCGPVKGIAIGRGLNGCEDV